MALTKEQMQELDEIAKKEDEAAKADLEKVKDFHESPECDEIFGKG